MAVRAGLIKCPFCTAHLQDTKQEFIDCKYCGKRFKRGAAKDKEEELRRNMVLDLSDKIQKMKVIISASKIFGGLFILLGVIWLFSEVFEFFEIMVTSLMFINGIVWLAIYGTYNSKLDKTQSKMFDLSGGRAAFDY
jgi:uncharacterized Zn-finger protein